MWKGKVVWRPVGVRWQMKRGGEEVEKGKSRMKGERNGEGGRQGGRGDPA